MGFDVIDDVRKGKKVRQKNWGNGVAIWLEIDRPSQWNQSGFANPSDLRDKIAQLITRPEAWGPFHESHTFAEAAKLIQEGKTVASGRAGIGRWNKKELVYVISPTPSAIATADDYVVVEAAL